MSRTAILGTAGHIDHGKTLLIKMLTGVDTDRLKEEKKRGISIELGFASIELPSGRKCGVVDVPGHEKFIRNMLAGAGGIDLILFVIAADEGIMPQTREHMDILQLLGVEEGVVALTKADLVDAEWLELITSEVRGFIDRTLLKGAPIVPLSSVTGRGKDELLRILDEKIERHETHPRGRFVRLPVDRVFTMEGFGTVVTGTLWNGRLREGDRVSLMPRGLATRIKALEVHNERVTEAVAGQRVAVCLHSVDREAAERGDWLVLDDTLAPVSQVDVRLHALAGLAKPIPHRMRVRFYLGASEVMGRVVLLDREELKPGESGFAQIQLEDRIVAERGDRFVIRSFSPMFTLGGGKVLDVSGARRRRFRAEDLATLKVAEEGSLDDRVVERLGARGAVGLLEVELTQLLGQPPAEIRLAIEQLLGEGRVRRVGKSRLVAADQFATAGATLAEFILEQEKAQSLRFGPQKSELKSRFEGRIHPEVGEAWIQEELGAGRLFARGDRLRRSSPDLPLSPRHTALRDRLLADLNEKGFSGPSQKEFIEAFAKDPDAAELLALLVAEETIVRLPGEILLPAPLLDQFRERLAAYFDQKSEMTIADLKEVFGVSRKQGVPLFEHADRLGWTNRRGDVRVAGHRLKARDEA
ncbi:MAG: selenocysteine-specific translation elongation factor [Candidatus Eisenbacteria bacterium]|nr:selenocysteine-specific translation elongation factor [Candidatus Eisenbacteria bacterium]